MLATQWFQRDQLDECWAPRSGAGYPAAILENAFILLESSVADEAFILLERDTDGTAGILLESDTNF